MISTVVGALPAAISAPIATVLATVDGRLLFAILWALAALAVGTIVRCAVAARERPRHPVLRLVPPPPAPDRRAA